MAEAPRKSGRVAGVALAMYPRPLVVPGYRAAFMRESSAPRSTQQSNNIVARSAHATATAVVSGAIAAKMLQNPKQLGREGSRRSPHMRQKSSHFQIDGEW
jgi:uncharacterized protein YcbK (DUF882 family)